MTNTSFITSYEVFCRNMRDALIKKNRDGSGVHLQTVRKTNGVLLWGITMASSTNKVMPTLYLDKYYHLYENGSSFEEVVTLFLREYREAGVGKDFDIRFFEEYEQVKKRLGFKLLHYEMNRELLEQVVHKRYLDLAAACFCDVKDPRIGHGFIMIKREHLEMWQIDAGQLIKDAMENMPRLYPADFMNMTVVLKELYEDPADILKQELPMYVLTNTDRVNGAASLLYEGQLEKISRILDREFYVLPSSVHEVILVPKNEDTQEEELSRIVDEINREHLEKEEILSDHAYRYDREKKELVSLPLIPE